MNIIIIQSTLLIFITLLNKANVLAYLKLFLQKKIMLLVAKTLYGLEHVLADEIKKIGGKGIEIRNRAISFEGSLELLYTANMMLRSATQILMPIKKFKINNADELYKKGIQVDWSKIFDINKTFSIKSTVNSIFFNHSNYPSLLLKDAIVDQFRKRTNRRPTVDSKFPDIKIDLHIENNFCTISLDSSGDLLYKRGYRKSVSIAPINEVLAAGIILLTKWNKETSFFDPMCGSGTFLIEAMMIAKNFPPNINRKYFGFTKWKNYDSKLHFKVRDRLKNQIIDKKIDIYGSDNNQKNVRICRENINTIFNYNSIKIKNIDFFETSTQKESFILFNPPYGERLRIEEDLFYEKIGNHLKHNFVGNEVWIFSQNNEEKKLRIGLKPSTKIKLKNGSIDCSLNKYEIFSGKNKERFN